MLYVATLIDGVDETSRIIRRTLMRYLTLGSLIVFQATSVRVKKRFPTMDHILEAGRVTHVHFIWTSIEPFFIYVEKLSSIELLFLKVIR